MSTSIFINLPVKDVKAATAFFARTGFAIDERFTSEEAACAVVADGVFVMLVSEPSFKDGSGREVADTSQVSEALLAVQVDRRERVDELVDAAIAAGGESNGDAMDESFMYSRGFRDLDGHLWNVLHMPATES
ncbi:hypothetical protein HII36_51180 [Nonomuraea sp. NN258]|uniref:VOC family protein n=1 Tax=Nonomuraea antri TaxID=2730852 RepID=UPI0015694C12|nr:VOC family protein [Nonomuraea antri]NRQ40135.1 hypothetical protein [Nonomuraea antri]